MTLATRSYLRILPVFAALPLAACAVNVGDDSVVGDGSAYFERVYYPDKLDTAVRGDTDIAEAALDYVAEQHELTQRMSLGDNFVVRSKLLGQDGLHHVRMDQAYDGIPVWGANITVHASNDEFKAVNGGLVKQLEGFDTVAVVSEEEAVSISHDDYVTLAKDGAGTLDYSRQVVELVIYPRSDRNMMLAWHVTFYTELQSGINPGLWNYFVDAKSGEIIDKFNGIHTAVVQASGPGGNAKRGTFTWDDLDVEDIGGGRGRMDTTRLLTVDMGNSESGSGTVVQGEISNFGDAAINDAHGYGEITLNMMLEWYGYESLDEQGFLIKSRVHYGSKYENAFWNGTEMTYGDGDTFFHPLSGSLDVVAHEFNHGFTSFHSNLTYSGQSGGINESFSDVVGVIAEYYREGTGADWDLGEDIFQNTGALRYMCNPPQDGKSIDHVEDYYNGLDVHYSSGVFNKAFCLASGRLAGGQPTQASVRRAGEAWFLANASYWNASTNFKQGCQGIMDAANALGFSPAEITAINQSFQDVGVFCDGAVEPLQCDETLTGDSGTFTSPGYPQAYGNNIDKTWCIQPANGQPATLEFDAFDLENNYDFVEIEDANGGLVSKSTGNSLPGAVTSTLIAVKMTSDASVTKGGFSAKWSTGQVQNERPTLTITSPSEGERLGGTINITADANDADGSIASVVFTLPDGSEIADDSAPYSVSWDSGLASDGAARISAIAIDDLGEASERSNVNIEVENGTVCVDGTFDNTTRVSIPDNNVTGITSEITVSGAGSIESLSLSLNITHTYRGDLMVSLTSPDGTTFDVHNGTGGGDDDLVISGAEISDFVGENAAGTWTLSVHDRYNQDTGDLNSWSLEIRGSCLGGGGNGDGNWAGAGAPNLATVDNSSACTSVNVADTGDASLAQIDLAGTHDWRSSLRGTLEHNGMTVEVFAAGKFDSRSGSFSLTNEPVSGFTGDASGDWTLCIIDTDAYNDTGVLQTWSVHN